MNKEITQKYCYKCKTLVTYKNEKMNVWITMFPNKGNKKWKWVEQKEIKLPNRCPICSNNL